MIQLINNQFITTEEINQVLRVNYQMPLQYYFQAKEKGNQLSWLGKMKLVVRQ